MTGVQTCALPICERRTPKHWVSVGVGIGKRRAKPQSARWPSPHIFGGGYAAGYYSYKWAEVLSADAFSRFEEEGVLSPVAGSAFRHEVLGRGGSRDAMTNFVAFRGRAPSVDALLRHNGMIAN